MIQRTIIYPACCGLRRITPPRFENSMLGPNDLNERAPPHAKPGELRMYPRLDGHLVHLNRAVFVTSILMVIFEAVNFVVSASIIVKYRRGR